MSAMISRRNLLIIAKNSNLLYKKTKRERKTTLKEEPADEKIRN